MNGISKDLISVLEFLLPGFISAWIFYGLTSYAKPSQFERVVQALIFTLFIQGFVQGFAALFKYSITFLGGPWEYFKFWKWDESFSLLSSIVLALVFGVCLSHYSNNDKFHSFLRNKGVTRETSFPSEWFGTFLNNVTFVVLHLHDERRLYGWPIEWPSEPTAGYFVIRDPSWLVGKRERRISGVKDILVAVKDVKWVEFLEKTWEQKNG